MAKPNETRLPNPPTPAGEGSLSLKDAFAMARKSHQDGDLARAETLYRLILKHAPDHAGTMHFLGTVVFQQHRPAEAEQVTRKAIQLKPDIAANFNILGCILAQQDRLDDATAAFQQSLQLAPDYAEACNNFARVYEKRDRLDLAASVYRRAVKLQPGCAKFHKDYGCVLARLKDFEQAVACFGEAIRLDPQLFEAYRNLGEALQKLRLFDEAADVYRKVIELSPGSLDDLNSLGCIIGAGGDSDAAIEIFKQVLAEQPGHLRANSNLGASLCDASRFDEGIEALQRAIELDSEYPGARFNLGMTLLRLGRFREGWQQYEYRYQCEPWNEDRRDYSRPKWDGQDIAGKRILLGWEQGLGDTIHFIRYAPLIARRGGEVIVECQRVLVRLMEAVEGVSEVVPVGYITPVYDYHCAMLGLPHAFDTTLENVPTNIPYIKPYPADVETWRERLGQPSGRLRVGLAWSGNPKGPSYKRNRIDVEMLAELLTVDGAEFFSLQIGESAGELARLDSDAITDLSPHIKDFADTAAVLTQLDMVISIDTALIHLAGAMGLPVWVMLTDVPDWRWMLDRQDSPWYPTARLFRQSSPKDWAEVIARVRQALQERVNQTDG